MNNFAPQQRVLLLELSERTSAKGNPYMAGWLGKASVVAFKAEHVDKHGNPVWQVFVTEPQQREEQRQQPATRHVGGAPKPLVAAAVATPAGHAGRGSQFRRPAERASAGRAPQGRCGAGRGLRGRRADRPAAGGMSERRPEAETPGRAISVLGEA